MAAESATQAIIKECQSEVVRADGEAKRLAPDIASLNVRIESIREKISALESGAQQLVSERQAKVNDLTKSCGELLLTGNSESPIEQVYAAQIALDEAKNKLKVAESVVVDLRAQEQILVAELTHLTSLRDHANRLALGAKAAIARANWDTAVNDLAVRGAELLQAHADAGRDARLQHFSNQIFDPERNAFRSVFSGLARSDASTSTAHLVGLRKALEDEKGLAQVVLSIEELSVINN